MLVSGIVALLTAAASSSQVAAPVPPAPRPRAEVGPIVGRDFTTQYIRFGRRGEGLLYRPATPGTKSRIALVFTHPGGNNFDAPIGAQLAARGYVVMNVNDRGGEEQGVDYQLATMSSAIGYLRSLPGIERVVASGHSGGAHEMALYEDVAENGRAVCAGPEKVYPCHAEGLDALAKPDGLILLDPPLGAFHEASSIDPAVSTDVDVRDPALDMFAAANGFDAAAGRASYTPAFMRRFYAAQAARNARLLADAQERLKAIEAGRGRFANDEPLTVPGLGRDAGGARLFQPDTALLLHTKAPHLLLKADGSREETIIRTVRPPTTQQAKQVRTLGTNSTSTTVRGYLARAAIRLTPNFAITEDDIVGVDWRSAYDSPPGAAAGIRKPTLIMAMGCHYLIVPAEIIFDRLAATDKTYAAVDGATHGFAPCQPQYGDTAKRLFDYVDEWLSKPGRF